VISLVAKHNQELYSEAELQQLPQNRYIPEEVQEKILSLFRLGNLNIGQIMTLIKEEHFPDIEVTWTKRDVQNLTQKVIDRNKEASDFLEKLEDKRNGSGNWSVKSSICRETMRLQRIFWMSEHGKLAYQRYSDVLEVDAT
jgi:hypothetical protein